MALLNTIDNMVTMIEGSKLYDNLVDGIVYDG